ncbi:MAG: DUF421 domain-containing protein [Burkholderiales bacterium]|nr:DUF421 domain-containing protein [Burkholderiales bacterium]
MFELDWHELFVPSVSLAETVLRGSAVYWFLFGLFRFVLRRDIGSVGIADVLVLVIIADASQNAMAGGYTSITDGFILISTIAFWNYLLDFLSFRFPKVARFAQGTPLCLVRDGRLMYRNMRKEFLTEEELMSKLRQSGVEDLAKVKRVYMEEDGEISVIRRDG